MEQKLNMKMGPEIDFEPTSVREPWHEESIGHVFFRFNFGQKFDVNHPRCSDINDVISAATFDRLR